MGGKNLSEAREVEENEAAPSQADQPLPLQLFEGPGYYLSRRSDACGELIMGQPHIQKDALAAGGPTAVCQLQEEPG